MLLRSGKYTGFYQYDDKEISKSLGFDKTYFTIDITNHNANSFYGNVEDDFLTGGLAGKGYVFGVYKNDKISFVKAMPYQGVLVKDITGKHKLIMDKHVMNPFVYYTGKYTTQGIFIGKWKFKYEIKKRIVFWFKGIKMSGTWKMSEEPNNRLS